MSENRQTSVNDERRDRYIKALAEAARAGDGPTPEAVALGAILGRDGPAVAADFDAVVLGQKRLAELAAQPRDELVARHKKLVAEAEARHHEADALRLKLDAKLSEVQAADGAADDVNSEIHAHDATAEYWSNGVGPVIVEAMTIALGALGAELPTTTC